ncbi:MAG: hypothetical protein HFJ27_04000 [Clostridia bacterium]|nr:hypothetical protein [Clostridia bacterium]
MKFKINNREWEIKEISNADMKNEYETENKFIHGITIYSENTICLNKDSKDMIKNLKHELIHAWLYEYGHNQDEKEFNNEDVCEIVASSNDFINEVIEEYKKQNIIETTDEEIYIDDQKIGVIISDEY